MLSQGSQRFSAVLPSLRRPSKVQLHLKNNSRLTIGIKLHFEDVTLDFGIDWIQTSENT